MTTVHKDEDAGTVRIDMTLGEAFDLLHVMTRAFCTGKYSADHTRFPLELALTGVDLTKTEVLRDGQR